MEGLVDSGLEIRRILLLTRLRAAPKGLTMDQIVRDCGKVSGWSSPGKSLAEIVQIVVQSLIDDGLAGVGRRFVIRDKGSQYLEDPLKWKIYEAPSGDVEQKQFWTTIYEIFDKAYRRLRAKSPAD